MKTKFVYCIFLTSIWTAVHGQYARKAVVNDSTDDQFFHQGANCFNFLNRAPDGWSCYLAGLGGTKNGVTYPGLNWNPWSGGDMIRMAADNGFDIVMNYGNGDIDPDAVNYAILHGCAVFTFLNANNSPRNYVDYRDFNSGPPVFGIGPMLAMTVSGGYPNSSGAETSYGPQSEFIDSIWNGGLNNGVPYYDDAQSWAHSATAARYAKLKDLHPTWNVFDLRQALRQTCSFYATGWREDGGYGFPKVLNRIGDAFTEVTLPQNLSDLDAGPPIQAYAQISSDGTQVVFHWYNFRQTGFASTVIKVNGVTIFDGDDTSFTWTSTASGLATAEFFTKLSDGRMSRSENYSKVTMKGLMTQPSPVASISYWQKSNDQLSFTVSGPQGSYWDVFESSDLVNWQQIGGVTLNSGPVTFVDDNLSGISHRFYKVSNGNACSQIVGYEQEAIETGYNLIANQLDASSDNTLNSIFSSSILPVGTVVTKHTDGIENSSTWDGTSWSDGNMVLEPGESAFIYNPDVPFTLTFVGLVREGKLIIPLADGYSYVSSIMPQAGGIQSVLGYNPVIGDNVLTWDGESYTSYVYIGNADLTDFPDGWIGPDGSSSEPIINVGEGIIIENNSGSIENWATDFEACSGQLNYVAPTIKDGLAAFSGPPNNLVIFTIVGPKGSSWNLYESSDLENWIPVNEITLSQEDGTYTYEDDSVTGIPCRFYRVSNGISASRAFGYEQEYVGTGYSLVANQFDVSIDDNIPASVEADQLGISSENSLALVFAQTEMFSVPTFSAGLTVNKWNGVNYVDTTWDGSNWSPDGTATLAPGESAMIYNPGAPFTLTFAGLVKEGQLNIPLADGYNLVSSMVPQVGGIKSVLGFNPEVGDAILKWSGSEWANYVYVGNMDLSDFPTGWIDGSTSGSAPEPTINMGEGFMIENSSGSSENWIRDFNIAN